MVRFGWIGAGVLAFSVALVVPRAMSDPGSSPAAAGVKVASQQLVLNTPRPTEWLPSKGRQCYRQKRYRNFCQGPRRAPMPYGPAAMLAKKLGLGDIKTMSRVMLEPPDPAWVAAAGTPNDFEKLLWPIADGQLWRGFGRVRRGNKRRRWHKGIDIGAPEGTLFRAVQGGLTIYSDNGIRGYGNMVAVVHPDATVAYYAHARALYLFPGQRVRRGQVLGEVGHTGIARGSHLHFEYRIQGRPKNPLPYFDLATIPELTRKRISPATQRKMTAGSTGQGRKSQGRKSQGRKP